MVPLEYKNWSRRYFLNRNERVQIKQKLREQIIGQKVQFQATLDLVEVRSKLIAMRSLHSHDPRIAGLINKTLVNFYHLREPIDQAQENFLRKTIADAIHKVQTMIAPGTGRI